MALGCAPIVKNLTWSAKARTVCSRSRIVDSWLRRDSECQRANSDLRLLTSDLNSRESSWCIAAVVCELIWKNVVVNVSLICLSINGVIVEDRILAKWLEMVGRSNNFSISVGKLCPSCEQTSSLQAKNAYPVQSVTQANAQMLLDRCLDLGPGNVLERR